MKVGIVLRAAVPAAVLGVLLLGAPVPSFAVTATAPIAVSATVVATCAISATNMGFGNYTGVVATATSTVTVQCTNSTPYTVSLNAGTSSGSTVTARKMTGAAGVYLNYGLYSDATYQTNFVTTASITGNGNTQPITVYGSVPAGQYVAPNTYTDTITATVTY
ncbi:MAG TPA: spore coat protein U domain-containing protein [Terracidiphilus sp.]|nr:spore coat protein U domain-containing protein [Terracidiphilus sp.]